MVWFLGEPAPGLVVDVSVTGATVVADALEPLAELVRGSRVAVATGMPAAAIPTSHATS